MTLDELKEKFLEGGKMAIKELIRKTKKENGSLVFIKDGKIVKQKAKDIKL